MDTVTICGYASWTQSQAVDARHRRNISLIVDSAAKSSRILCLLSAVVIVILERTRVNTGVPSSLTLLTVNGQLHSSGSYDAVCC